MPLDPQCEMLLQGMEAQGQPPLHELSVPEARDVVNAFRQFQGDPDPVAKIDDILVPGPDGDLPVRVYTPSEPLGSPPPVLVFFHGGGWVIGNLLLTDNPCRMLANATGCIVANVEYRLAPETKFPGPLEDCYAATKWIAEHAAELGGDPRRVGVAGDSAGGNLAAATALVARDRGGPDLAHQLLIYPVTAPARSNPFPSYEDNGDGYLLTREGMEWFWAQYVRTEEDDRNPYAAPLHATDHAGLPPAFIVTCEFDPLRDEGEAYADKLREAGGTATTERLDGQIHGIFWLPGVLDSGKNLYARVGQEIKNVFG